MQISLSNNLRISVWRLGLCLNIVISLCMIAGCQSESKVFYEGRTHTKKLSDAELTTLTPIELTRAGYQMIGTFKSEPTTYGLSVSKKAFEENPQKILESLSPENVESLKPYYELLDKDVCYAAAKIGGEKVRLERIEKTYPELRQDIAELMQKALASDLVVKHVTSIKRWSVWRRNDLGR